jgi:hypothetical protein
MIDIPRHELLDKLAAGWKVRIKSKYAGDNNYNLKTMHELRGMDFGCLIDREWEGEPHQPMLKYGNLDIHTAFKQLNNTGAAFICRADWRNTKITLNNCNEVLHFLQRDILCKDWEVWG